MDNEAICKIFERSFSRIKISFCTYEVKVGMLLILKGLGKITKIIRPVLCLVDNTYDKFLILGGGTLVIISNVGQIVTVRRCGKKVIVLVIPVLCCGHARVDVTEADGAHRLSLSRQRPRP